MNTRLCERPAGQSMEKSYLPFLRGVGLGSPFAAKWQHSQVGINHLEKQKKKYLNHGINKPRFIRASTYVCVFFCVHIVCAALNRINLTSCKEIVFVVLFLR